MTDIPENTFAAACYDQNSVEELLEGLRSGSDAADCAKWGLSPAGWTSQIKLALAAKLEDEADDDA